MVSGNAIGLPVAGKQAALIRGDHGPEAVGHTCFSKEEGYLKSLAALICFSSYDDSFSVSSCVCVWQFYVFSVFYHKA